jgi:protein ImuA
MNTAPLTPATAALPEHLAQAVWQGDALGGVPQQVIASGHAQLDAELPGGGWPCQSMTELLQTPTAHTEWRLLGPALAELVRRGGSVLLIGPALRPHLPGLCLEGLRDDRLIRIDADKPADRLWATEQALKARCVSAVLSWLPRARPEQIRRLQACAAQHPGPLFVFRPEQARQDASAAPLRLVLSQGAYPHPLQVDIIKRRGPALARPLTLPHWPNRVAPLLQGARRVAQRPGLMPSTQAAHPTASPQPTGLTPARPMSLGSPAQASSTPSPHQPHAALDGLAAWAAPQP